MCEQQQRSNNADKLPPSLSLFLCLPCSYLPQDSSLQSETVHFKRGVCQQFCLPSHTVNLSEWADDEVGGLRLRADGYVVERGVAFCRQSISRVSLLSCCLTWTRRSSPWLCRPSWTRERVSFVRLWDAKVEQQNFKHFFFLCRTFGTLAHTASYLWKGKTLIWEFAALSLGDTNTFCGCDICNQHYTLLLYHRQYLKE